MLRTRWEDELVTPDGQTLKLWGRMAGGLDEAAAMRFAGIRRPDGDPTAALYKAAYGRCVQLLYSQYMDVVYDVYFQRCIKSHRVGDYPGAVFTIHELEDDERERLMEKIMAALNAKWVEAEAEANAQALAKGNDGEQEEPVDWEKVPQPEIEEPIQVPKPEEEGKELADKFPAPPHKAEPAGDSEGDGENP